MQLPISVFRGEGAIDVGVHCRQVAWKERLPHFEHKGLQRFPLFGRGTVSAQVVKEDAPDAPRFVAVWQEEVAVRLGLERLVIGARVRVACRLQHVMELRGLLGIDVVGRHVDAAAKPARSVA